jgi:small subunit ribosomal protein S1
MLLEEQAKAGAAEVRRSLTVGAVVTGRVASVREFGAFVDLGSGVQGLLHVSEMSWSRVADPSDVVKPGDEITVKVLRIEQDGQKISLGLKQLAGDPWAGVQDTCTVGSVHRGRVTRIAEFGAFVELAPGVEALAHATTFDPAGGKGAWSAGIAPGTIGAFEILSVDLDKRRIGVRLIPEGSSRAAAATGAGPASEAGEDGGEVPEAPARLGSLADKLRGALDPKRK